MVKKILFASLFFISTASFAQIDLTSGTTGIIPPFAQSFNETRGVDVKIISPNDILISSMTLHRFYCRTGDSAYVGARIYDPANGVCLASNTVGVYNLINGNVTVPVSFTLVSGMTYRISFFCGGPNQPTGNTAAEFQPSALPYNDGSNMIQIINAYAYPADTFPSATNIYVPFITLFTVTAGLNNPTDNNDVFIYPNPSSGTIFLEPGNINEAGLILSLYDAGGKEVYSGSFHGKNNLELDRKKIAAGKYFYRLQQNNKIIKNGKIVLTAD